MAGADGKPLRRPGLPLWKQGTKLRAANLVPNTKGLPKAMRAAMLYWEGDEAARLARQAEIKRKEQALAEEKRQAGMMA